MHRHHCAIVSFSLKSASCLELYELISPISFAGRLPDICTDLNRKLGGPVAVTPPKPKKPTASIPGKVAARPGAATKRPTAAMACQSLEKALESEKRTASRRPVDVLARMRSATPAAIPGVKREASEPLSLERMASGNKSLKERSRNLLSRSVSSVDVVDLKAQKKAKVEAELKEAISALKKPNRQLAGASLAEEKAKLTASSSSPRPRSKLAPSCFSSQLSVRPVLTHNLQNKRSQCGMPLPLLPIESK